MGSTARLASTAAVVAALLVPAAIAQPVLEGGRRFTVELTGEAELTGGAAAADLDGSGTAVVVVNVGQRRVCWDIEVEDLDPLVAAHIHRGLVDESGGIEVTFFHFGQPVDLEGCASDLDRDLLREIVSRPERFYVNIHTTEFPPGAIRGQLSRTP